MAHIGVLIPGALGHLNPASCLGRELQARGHRITVFQVLDLEHAVRRTGLEYQVIGEDQFPRGRYNGYIAQSGNSQRAGRSAVYDLVLCVQEPDALRGRPGPDSRARDRPVTG